MIQKTAALLVIVFSMSASARLACIWTCEDAAAAHHAARCHDSEGGAVLVNGTSHECDHDALGPVSTTAKNTAFQQSGALFSDVVAHATTELTSAKLQLFALAPAALAAPHAPLKSILRI